MTPLPSRNVGHANSRSRRRVFSIPNACLSFFRCALTPLGSLPIIVRGARSHSMMKKVLVALAVLCALSGWLPAQEPKPSAPPSAPQNPSTPTVIKIPVYLVNVPLTVTDKKNRLVIMMTKDDFNLFEDGKRQTIQYFSRETDLALRIGLLIDTSNSIRDRLRFEQQA